MKQILVVGGNSGIGKDIVKQLRNRNPVVLAPLQQSLDISDFKSIRAYIKDNGPFDQIVYSAGVARLTWAEDLTLEDYVHDYTINAFGFGLLIGAHVEFFRTFAEDNATEIPRPFSAVAIVSDAYKMSMRGSLTYCSSKAALASIVKGLARELAPYCRVNGIAPAVVDGTAMTNYIDDTVPEFRGWDAKKAAAYEKSMLPMGRRVEKSEVTEVVLSLLNGPAYLTGSIVEMNGGKG